MKESDILEKIRTLTGLAQNYLDKLQDIVRLLQLQQVDEALQEEETLRQLAENLRKTQEEFISQLEYNFHIKIADFSQFLKEHFAGNEDLALANKKFLELLSKAEDKLRSITKELEVQLKNTGAELKKLQLGRDMLHTYYPAHTRHFFNKKG